MGVHQGHIQNVHSPVYGGDITGYYREHESAASLTLKPTRRLCCQRTGSFRKIIWKGEPVWCALPDGISACHGEIHISVAEISTNLHWQQSAKWQPDRVMPANTGKMLRYFQVAPLKWECLVSRVR